MEFKEEVVQFIIQSAERIMGADPATLTGATSFKEDLKCKSVNIVQFAAALEDEYEVEVPFMQLNKCDTFADAAQLVDDAFSM